MSNLSQFQIHNDLYQRWRAYRKEARAEMASGILTASYDYVEWLERQLFNEEVAHTDTRAALVEALAKEADYD